MTALAGLVRSFAALLVPQADNGSLLQQWIATARATDLPHPHGFSNGLATWTLRPPPPRSPCPTTMAAPKESTPCQTKMIKRQMYGRAGFTLLRHRILLS